MKKSFIKKRFADLKLKAFLFKCSNCGSERVNYSFSGGEWEATVECGICSAIVVFDIFNIPEAVDAFFGAGNIPGYSEFSDDTKLAIQEEKDTALLKSIPACPRCHSHNFQDLRMRASYPLKGFICKKCGTDLAETKNSTIHGLPDSSDMDAWWYEVVNDDKPETPDNH